MEKITTPKTKWLVQIVARSPYGRVYYKTVRATLSNLEARKTQLGYEMLGHLTRIIEKEVRG